MSLSSQLRFKMRSERDAVIALDKATSAVIKNGIETLDDVKAGFERASWYSSCLFDNYKDVCSELNNENKRFFLAIGEVYKRRDVIYDMIKLYIEHEAKDIDDNKIRDLDRKIAGMISSYQAGKVTKLAIVNSITLIISNSFKFNSVVLAAINRNALIIVTAASLYGKIQKSALCARKLKMTNPNLYWLIYKNRIEMLYFLIADRVNKSIIESSGKIGEERFIAIINALVS